jgi:hypothetical protein
VNKPSDWPHGKILRFGTVRKLAKALDVYPRELRRGE